MTKKHIGQWTCAGRLFGKVQESSDDFSVHVFDTEQPSVAAISGMVIGAVLALLIVGGAALFTYRRMYIMRRSRINNDSTSDTVSQSSAIPMGPIGRVRAARDGERVVAI